MKKKIRFLNFCLLLSTFSLLSLVARDYIFYKHIPQPYTTGKGSISSPPPTPRFKDYALIVEGQAFPSATTRLVRIDGATTGAVKKGKAATTAFGDLSLIGTFVGATSFAVFEDKRTDRQDVFKIGETVFKAGILKHIDREKVEIEGHGRTMSYAMAQKAMAPARSKPLPSLHEGGSARTNLSKKVGETQWVLDRKAVFNALEDMGRVMTDARLTPQVKDGRVEGFLVAEIRPRGIFDAIGLGDGDILVRVNGYEIDSPEKVIQVLSALKGQTEIELDLVRKGKKMRFHYEIR